VRIFLEISVRTHRSAEQRRWADAERAYELGKDSDNVVRLNLEKLNNPEKAFDIARKGRTPASARLIAKFSIKNSDFMTAIEFLLGAKLVDEAFELAQVGIRKLM
jgi:WD repeat-containing protein 19